MVWWRQMELRQFSGDLVDCSGGGGSGSGSGVVVFVECGKTVVNVVAVNEIVNEIVGRVDGLRMEQQNDPFYISALSLLRLRDSEMIMRIEKVDIIKICQIKKAHVLFRET